MSRLLAALPLLALLAACPSREVECRTGADCASGACRGDGTCAPAQDSGAPDGGEVSDAGQDPDAGFDAGLDAGPGDGGNPLTCTPNHDGVITRAEMPMGAGLHATYRVARNVSVSTLGSAGADGGREWDFGAALTGDHALLVETRPLEGAWFQADFPGASYVAQLSDGQDLLGVFETTPDALLLRGIVSPAGGVTSTKLIYSPPAKVLSFPLSTGGTFTSTSTVSGTLSGVVVAIPYTEEYASASDLAGEVVTPFGRFPVQRVRVQLKQGGINFKRQHLFVTECFGTVATVVSQTYEPAVDFTNAAEVRRLSP